MNGDFRVIKIIIAITIGTATSIAPPVLLTYGVSQFIIVNIVGNELATWWFSISLGIVSLSIILLNPLGGYLFDKTNNSFSSKRVWIILGSFLGGLSLLAFAHAENMFILIIFWVLGSFSYGIVTLAYFVLIPEQFKKNNLGKVSGLVGTLIPLLLMVISIIVLGVFSYLPIENKILAIVSLQLVCNLITILFIKESKNNTSNVSEKSPQKSLQKYVYPSFKEYPDFTWTLFSKLCINLVTSGLSMLTLFYMERFNLSEKDIFEIHALTSSGVILMVAFGILSGYLSDKKNTKKIFIIISSLIMSACMFFYSISYSIIFVIFLSFIYQCAFGIFNSVDLALVNQVLPSKKNYAKDIAIMNTTSHIAKAVISFATPAILALGSDLMGDDGFTLFFFLLAIFSLLSMLFVSQVSEK